MGLAYTWLMLFSRKIGSAMASNSFKAYGDCYIKRSNLPTNITFNKLKV